MADKIAAARKRLLSELGHRVQMTEHGIADGDGRRRKVGFIHGALQKGTGGQDHFPRTGTQGKKQEGMLQELPILLDFILHLGLTP